MLGKAAEHVRSSFNMVEHYMREPYIVQNPKISITDLARTECELCLYKTLERKVLGTQEDFKPNTHRTFAMGKLHEEYLFEIMQKFPDCRIIEQQHTLETEHVKGKLDAILEYQGEQYVLEIKMMNSFFFNDAQKKTYVQENYRDQLNLYLHLAMPKFKNMAHRGIFVLINRDNSDICVLESAPVDNARAIMLLETAKLVHNAFLAGTKDKVYKYFECNRCN